MAVPLSDFVLLSTRADPFSWVRALCQLLGKLSRVQSVLHTWMFGHGLLRFRLWKQTRS